MLLDYGRTHTYCNNRRNSTERVVAITNRQTKLIGNQADRIQVENVQLSRVLRCAVQNGHLVEHQLTNSFASVVLFESGIGRLSICGNNPVGTGITEGDELECLRDLVHGCHSGRNDHGQIRFARLNQHRSEGDVTRRNLDHRNLEFINQKTQFIEVKTGRQKTDAYLFAVIAQASEFLVA